MKYTQSFSIAAVATLLFNTLHAQLVVSVHAMKIKHLLVLAVLWFASQAGAQLLVTVSPPKVAGQKVVTPLAMKNSFNVNIQSARAAVFLLDDQGKMVGQGTRWVIGGGKDKA